VRAAFAEEEEREEEAPKGETEDSLDGKLTLEFPNPGLSCPDPDKEFAEDPFP